MTVFCNTSECLTNWKSDFGEPEGMTRISTLPPTLPRFGTDCLCAPVWAKTGAALMSRPAMALRVRACDFLFKLYTGWFATTAPESG